ncbi:hypothetical protein J2T05_003709 [Cupriavidus necator]|nr:hypothetical protein [Cupriavidus necator]
MRWRLLWKFAENGGKPAAAGCFKNATVRPKAIAATASHSRTDKLRQRHNLHVHLPLACATTPSPGKTLVTLQKHPVTLVSSCNKLGLRAINKIKSLALLARISLTGLLQDERRATAATAVPGRVRLFGSRVTLAALHDTRARENPRASARLQQGRRRASARWNPWTHAPDPWCPAAMNSSTGSSFQARAFLAGRQGTPAAPQPSFPALQKRAHCSAASKFLVSFAP